MLYNSMLDIKKIESVYHKVKCNTKHKEKIVNFETFYITNIMQIYEILEQRKYRHGKYNIFLVKEYKYRLIMSENISDKIINHLISNEILLPNIEPRLIDMNVATRKNKGTKHGLYYTKKYLNAIRAKHENFYILKCDIQKYFYNIDHEILLAKLTKIIKDDEALDIVRNILNTTNNEETNIEIKKAIEGEKKRLLKTNNKHIKDKFKELDNIPLYEYNKGLPIGNLSSQILAVFYLNDIDHYIKEKLHCKYYVRYMDDFIIFHEDKEYLKYVLKEVKEKLHTDCKLNLHPKKTKIFSIKEGLTFLGYHFIIKNNHLITLMNPKTKKKIRKNIKRVIKKDLPNKENTFASYNGYFKNCSCKSFINHNDFDYFK